MRTPIFCVVTLGLVASVAGAVVRNVPSALYPTIQSAENAALAGDTINIAAGVYTENVEVDVNNLIIQGFCSSASAVIVDGTDGRVFEIHSNNVTIKCLTTRNGAIGISTDGTGSQLQSLRILSASRQGLFVNADGFRILAVEVRGAGERGIWVYSGDNGIIQSTTVRNAGRSCIELEDSDHTVVTSNTLSQCGSYVFPTFFFDGFGVGITGDDNTVSNNTISNTFDSGIYSDGARATIWKNTLKNNAWTGDSISVIGADAKIDDNRATNCYGDCIDVSGDGAKVRRNTLQAAGSSCYFGEGADYLVADNVCTDSDDGFYHRGAGLRMERNVAERTETVAFDITSDDMKVLNNRATDGGSEDAFYLYCSDCDATEVRNNESVRQGNLNYYFADSSFYLNFSGGGSIVSGNRATDGAGPGFSVYASSCSLTNNIASGNGAPPSPGFQVVGDSNTLSFNQALENSGPGFSIEGSSNVLSQNSAVRNLQEGFFISSGSDNRLSQNVVNANAAEGIDNNGAATDLLFNASSANRRDCTNDGSFDQRVGNTCSDGSNFNETSQVDN